jgi:hypothetical protein
VTDLGVHTYTYQLGLFKNTHLSVMKVSKNTPVCHESHTYNLIAGSDSLIVGSDSLIVGSDTATI